MGIAWHSSNCDSSELGCSSTSKQPTLQHTFIPWQGWRTPRLCPVSQEIWTHPWAPQATKHGLCQQQSCSQAALPCHGKALCHLQGCWFWSKQGPGGVQHVRDEQRGWQWDWSDAGPCITCQTTGQAFLGALTQAWAHLGQHWEPAGHRNRSGRAQCGSAQHSWHCLLLTSCSVIPRKH